MYNSFYFLHIPKCDGRRFVDKFVTPLRKSNPGLVVYDNEKSVKDYTVISSYPPVIKNGVVEKTPIKHQGWDDRIDEGTYIVCLMRDPIERAVSYYVYLVTKAAERLNGFDKRKNINFLKEPFFKLMELDKRFHNPVSKSFLNDLGKNRSHSLDDSALAIESNKNLILSRAKRINLLIDVEAFKSMDKIAISDKIVKDLGCDSFTPDTSNFGMSNGYTIPSSKILYESLTEDEKQNLRQYLELDYEIYENKSLFWTPE